MEVIERILFVDTETTGLDPKLGHRLIEVAAVEAINRRLTGKVLHQRVNPEREIDAGASAVHGMTLEDLVGKPRFGEIADEFIEFVRGSVVVIHNAAFDLGFLDSELTRARKPDTKALGLTVIDSLMLAREQFPGKRNSLDALCDRLGVDNSARNVHGALLDCRLLAEVYFALTRGQASLGMDDNADADRAQAAQLLAHNTERFTGKLVALGVPDASLVAHSAWVESMGASAKPWH
jgi:DNA polymerase III subunit epsilon